MLQTADDDALVHREALDRCAAAAAARVQVIAVERVVERLGAEVAQQFVGLAMRLPQQAAEAARVVEAQQATVFQADIDMVVRAHRRVAGQHAQAAGHAQVQHGAAGVGIEQQVFGAAADRGDALAGQFAFDFRRDRP